MITELICFKPEVCICDGNKLKFQGESVSVTREFRPTFPQICLCSGNPFFLQHNSVSVIELILRLQPRVQESPHHRAPKSPKSLKKDFPAQSVNKVSKKSQMTRKRVKKDCKISVRGLFRHFFDTPAREVLFETFWGFRGSGVWRLLYMGIAIVIVIAFRNMSVCSNFRSCCHQKDNSLNRKIGKPAFPSLFGDKFGESLGGSQAPPSFWKVPRLPRKFPQLPWKFFGDFPRISLTVELNSNPGVPQKFPRLPRKFPELPRRFPALPRRSAPFSGKPDTLS